MTSKSSSRIPLRNQLNTSRPPILRSKKYDHPSLFDPESLLREARRQKNIPKGQIPSICILDPDGDIVNTLVATDRAKVNSYWACYHRSLYSFEHKGIEFGIVGFRLPTVDYRYFFRTSFAQAKTFLELIATTAKSWLSSETSEGQNFCP